ncbi:MAG: ATP-dependent Clp protease proteolytic subunit [Candidatus Zixiibacteriota bacterium]
MKNGKKKVAVHPQELRDFAEARGRSAVFLFLPESLELVNVYQLQLLLEDRSFRELDIVIHSGGGDVNAAYQICNLLRNRTKRLTACVPFFAKSAATLLCIGADEMVLGELAELGPLDTQILETKRGGKRGFTSALNPFKTLEQLQRFSLETLDLAVKMIAERSGMGLDECLRHATEFVKVTTDPLFRQLDPEKLGEYSRALSIGKDYGDRLLRRFARWEEDKRAEVLDRLVYRYPSHDYAINCAELQEMGFQARYFDGKERQAAKGFVNLIGQRAQVVELVSLPETADTGAVTPS